jgi:tetratricopeptide (TPR) repeat protein
MFRLRLLFAIGVLLLSASPAFSKECLVVHLRPETPADTALRTGHLADAEKLYTAELDKAPNANVSLSGLILSQLYQSHIDTALATAQDAMKRVPTSATLVADLAQIQFRAGDLEAARASIQRALALDSCNARIFFVWADYLHALSLRASARDRLNSAHGLSPDDPEIGGAWLEEQSRTARISALKNRLADKNLAEEEKVSLSSALERLEALRKAEAEHGKCKVVSTAASMKLPFTYILHDASTIRAFALDVRINNKATARLQIDTGASGIIIRRGLASKAGLTPLIQTKYFGVGDDGIRTSYTAVANDLKIGQFEFQNCPVEVSDKRSVAEEDGLIGGDVFQDYLLTIDFPDRLIKVDPLPQRPGNQQQATLESEADADDAASEQDAYRDPSMKDWTRVLRIGHDLMVSVDLGDSKIHWFVLDTGSFATILSPAAARTVTKVSRDRDTEIKGLSGNVKEVFHGKNVEVTFGGVQQKLQDAVVMNFDRISDSTGVEVSGFLGFGTLQYLVMQIDYRDGLVHFAYDPKHGTNRFY